MAASTHAAPTRAAPTRDAPTRDEARQQIADRLLTSLDDLVRRHRALVLTGGHADLHAELIAAEVAHELARTRDALHRHPRPA